ncbi:MAG: pitrilysin family protein [Planctomycetota bacterium]
MSDPVPTAAAEPGASTAQRITTVEGITEYALHNGLQVLLFPDDSKPTLTVNITYLVGSRHEGYGETGMAHLLEHMLFRGTPRHPQIWKELQEHGAQFNGTTSYDRTNYYETLTASESHLCFALDLEADRMVNSSIAAADLAAEMTVVRNEFEIGENDPAGVLAERVRSTAFLWHNYGKSTIGSRADIERVPVERLQTFYRKYYQPDNAVLVVAGRFDEAATLERIVHVFGKIPRPARQLDRTYTVEPAQDGEREVTLRRNGDVQALACVYHAASGTHADNAPLEVLANTLSTDQTGRLYRVLIETRLATSVDADVESLHDPGVFEIMVQARTDQSMPAIKERLFQVLDGLGRERFTDEEVNRARAQFARSFDLMMNDSQRVALRLTESAAIGDWRIMFLHRDRIAGVTPADVQRVAEHYLKPSNRTVGTFIPSRDCDRTIVPASPDLAQILNDYRGGEPIARGAAFEPTHENIEAHTLRSSLPGGMKLALLPKATRGHSVRAQLVCRYAAAADLSTRTEAAALLGPLMMRGTRRHTRRQIDDRLAELKAQLRVGRIGTGLLRESLGGPGSLGVSIETSRANLGAVLELMAEILREPAFPTDEFEQLRQETLAEIEQQISEPFALCMNALQRHLSPYPSTDVRYVPTPAERAERIEALALDEIRQVHGWLGASAGEVVFVGAFDPVQLTRFLGDQLASWPAGRPYQRIGSPYQEVPPAAVVLDTPDKTSAAFAMGMPIKIRDDEPDYPALSIGNFILGGSLSSRLMNRLRQKDGFSYGCGSSLGASAFEQSGAFLAYGMCAPENIAGAISAAREELERLLADGITPQELDDARKGYREQEAVLLAQDRLLAQLLLASLHADRTLQFAQAMLAKIERLEPADVVAAFARHVQPDRLVVVRAGDFKQRG